MKKNQHITAFYVETILLIVVFMTIIMVLTNVFGAGRSQSSAAKRLTRAVSLAENAAEAVAASDSPEAVLALLDEGGSASLLENREPVTFEARYDENMNPDPEGRFRVDVTWEPQEQDAGAGVIREESDRTYVYSHIAVLFDNASAPVYTLETSVYIKEVGR